MHQRRVRKKISAKHPLLKRGKPVVSREAPLRERIREQILQRIVLGELKPGVPLREVELSKEFGTSRIPLREAMFLLEREGFVKSEPERGFKVAPLSFEEVRNLYPILWTLESLALSEGWRATCTKLKELKSLNATLLELQNQPLHAFEVDSQWHTLLTQGSANSQLLRLLALLRMRISRYEHLFMEQATDLSRSVQQHAQVVEALEVSDLNQATNALIENWRTGMDTLLNLLVKEQESGGN